MVIGASAREPTSGDGFKTTIRRVVVHPGYNLSGSSLKPHIFQHGIDDYDIVVAELDDEAPSSKRTMQLNTNAGVPRVGEAVRTVGYGDELQTSMDRVTLLRQVDLRVFGSEKCNELIYPFTQGFTNRQNCAWSERERCGPW